MNEGFDKAENLPAYSVYEFLKNFVSSDCVDDGTWAYDETDADTVAFKSVLSAKCNTIRN